MGKGVLVAVKNVNDVMGPTLIGKSYAPLNSTIYVHKYYIYSYINISINIYVYVSIYVYIYIYIYIYICGCEEY
jgi:hypothetical protein